MKAQNQTEAKRKNKNNILKLILTGHPISRIELARETGLTKMTVTNLVGELIHEGIVAETGVTNTAAGRKPVQLGIVPGARQVLGIYISRDFISTFLGDFCGSVTLEERVPLKDETNETFLEKLFSQTERIFRAETTKNLCAVGISCIGPLDRKKGVILNPPNFYGIQNLEISKLLKNRYALPVFIDNDMNTSALAEHYFGRAKHKKHFIYLGVARGIGAGVVANGRLQAGERGYSAEIGHVTVDIHGIPCSCGNTGCLELYASFPAEWENMNAERQQEKLKEMCYYLSAGCVTLINLFDPQTIYLGHEIAKCADRAVPLLQKYIGDRYLGSQYKQITVEASAFQDNSPVYGAVALCAEQLLE